MTVLNNMRRKDTQPLVSVIMPAYSAGWYISESIESIVRQTYKNIEFIIIDDGSPDNLETWKIIKKYKKRYPKVIKAIRLKKNMGRGGDAAANIAFRVAKGEFVARIDSDDIALPDRIEKQIKYMQENPEVSIFGTNAHVINSQGVVVGEKKVPLTHKAIYEAYFTFHPMINPSIMVRKSRIRNPRDLYLNDNSTNNDYLTFFKRISAGVIFANHPEKLMYYRIHEKNDCLSKVRRTFKNSLITRYRAVTEFGYRPSVFSILKLMAQIVVVYALPEKLVFQLYLVIRGINKPSNYFANFRSFVSDKLKKVEELASS